MTDLEHTTNVRWSDGKQALQTVLLCYRDRVDTPIDITPIGRYADSHYVDSAYNAFWS